MADHTADDMPVQPVVDRGHGHIHRVRGLRSTSARIHIGDRRDRAVLHRRQILLLPRIHGTRVGQFVQQRSEASQLQRTAIHY